MTALFPILLLACTELPIDHGKEPVDTAPTTGGCSLGERALAPGEVGPFGYSAADVDAVIAGTRTAELTWADGGVATVSVEVAGVGDAMLLTWTQEIATATCPADELRVGYAVRVWTDDGAVDATVEATVGGSTLPTELFLSAYADPAEVSGSLTPPTDAESLSVVVHHRDDGSTNGVLQWVVQGTGMPSEVDLATWGSYTE